MTMAVLMKRARGAGRSRAIVIIAGRGASHGKGRAGGEIKQNKERGRGAALRRPMMGGEGGISAQNELECAISSLRLGLRTSPRAWPERAARALPAGGGGMRPPAVVRTFLVCAVPRPFPCCVIRFGTRLYPLFFSFLAPLVWRYKGRAWRGASLRQRRCADRRGEHR